MKAQRGFVSPAFLSIFGLVPGWVYAAALVVVGLMLLSAKHSFNNEVAAHAVTTADFANYRSNVEKRENVRAQFALQETEKQREIERLRNAAASATSALVAAEARRNSELLHEYRRRNGLLSAEIARIAPAGSGGGQGGGDSPALRRAEAAASTLGSLLETCRREAGEDAGELEDLASQVRGLILRYESLLKAPSPASMPPTPPSKSGTSAPSAVLLLRSTTGLGALPTTSAQPLS